MLKKFHFEILKDFISLKIRNKKKPMSDYINYIDFRALALGNTAFEVGDYDLAQQQFSKVLSRLRNYQGDRMQPAYLAQELNNKITMAKEKFVNPTPILRSERWMLSKTSFVKGEQCEKQLYLETYKKEEKTPFSKATQALFKMGHSFEDDFRQTKFLEGINVKERVKDFTYFNSYTRHALSQDKSTTLFEATFIEEGVLVMCDIVNKVAEDTFDFYEIKLNNEITEGIMNDLAIQYYVCKKRYPTQIRSFNLVLKDSPAKIIDLKEECEARLDWVEERIATFQNILINQDQEPQKQMGAHCDAPYTCQFKAYCERKKGN